MTLPTHLLEIGDRSVDLVRGHVVGPGYQDRLTATELKLFGYLANRLGEPVSRDELYLKVWGYHTSVRSRALDAAMRRLRTKLERDPSSPRFLLTVPGMGYQLVSDCAPPTLAITGSRAVLPEWRRGVDKLILETQTLLAGADSQALVSTGIIALRTLSRVGPRQRGVELSAELLGAALTPWERAWVLAETLPLLKGRPFTERAEEALAIAEAHGDPALGAVVRLMSARGQNRVPRLEEALELASQIDSPRLQMRALSQLATTLPRGATHQAQSLYLRAFELADVGANEWEEAVLQANYARFLAQVGATGEAVVRLQDALEVFQAWQDRPNTVMSHLNLGVLENNRNRFVVARTHYANGQDEALRLGDRSLWVICRLGELAVGERLESVDISEVEALLKECRLREYQPEQVAALGLMGLTWRSRGQLDLARAPLERALELAESAGVEDLIGECRGNLGVLLIELQEPDRGVGLLRSAIEAQLERQDQDNVLARFLLYWHELGCAEVPEFRARLEQLASKLPAATEPPWEGLTRYAQASN